MSSALNTETGAAAAQDRRGLTRLLEAAYDPEWLVCFVVLLTPALLFALLREPLKARFFVGSAIYIGVLKWLGWAAVGRSSKTDLSYLLFPIQVFAGLAVACTWFYLRNNLARLWPASYSLRELSILIYLLLPLHVAGSLRRERVRWRELGRRLALYLPFITCLTVALWHVSGLLGVLGTDSIQYVFGARVYLHNGIDFAVPPLGQTIVYPTALSGMTALAAAVAPLSVVQAFHLQHVLFCILSLFAITTTLALLAQRPLGCLHSVPLPFLTVFPLYALYPDILYPGVPKQLGPPLCAAVCLLPLVLPPTRLRDFCVAAWIIAMLTALAADANPACVPYAAFAAAIALIVLCRRGRALAGLSIWRIGTVQLCATVLASLLVLAADPWYRDFVQSIVHVKEAAPVVALEPGEKGTFFSTTEAARQFANVSPLRLSPAISLTAYDSNFLDSVRGWPAHWPQQVLPWAAVLLTGMYVLSRVMSRGGSRPSSLGLFAVTCLLLDVGLKYAATFVAGGISLASWQGTILHVYTRFLLTRCDVLLLFTCVLAASVWLVVALPGDRRPTRSARGLRLVLTIVLCWILPGYLIVSESCMSGCARIPVDHRFTVTGDDLELVAWADAHLPAEKGTIGLAAFTFEAGPNKVEKHIYPVGSGVAFGFYSSRYRVRFLVPSLENGAVLEDYRQHVRDRFDAEWCLRNGIGYFYVPAAAFEANPGIVKAIRRGELRPLRGTEAAALYEINPAASQHAIKGGAK